MSNCEHNRELLSDFLDGTLDAVRSIVLSEHLDACYYCRAEYHALRNTIGLLQSAGAPDGAAAQRLALVNLRNVALAHASAPRRSFPAFRFAAAGLAAATLLAITIQNGSRNDTVTGTMPLQLQARGAGSHSLPTALELDEMASQHALHSFAIAAGDAGEDQEALADATSRLH